MSGTLDGQPIGGMQVIMPGQDRRYHKPKDLGVGRKCPSCGKKMNRYNQGRLCYSCDERNNDEEG